MTESFPWGLRYASHMGFRSPFSPLFQHTVNSSDPGEHVRFTARLGFHGVLYPWALSSTPAQIESFRQAACATGIEGSCVVFAPFEEFRQPVWGGSSESDQALLERRITRACGLAREIRSQTICVIATVDPEGERLRQAEAFIRNLQHAGAIAEDFGISLVIETMRSVPNMLIPSYTELYETIGHVGRSNVRMVFDTFHVRTIEGEGSVLSGLEQWYERIGLIQLADYPDKVEPGAGTLDFIPVLAAAMKRGFRGLVELEHFWSGKGALGEAQGLERLRNIDAAARQRALEDRT